MLEINFLLLFTFCTYLEECSNFEIEAILRFMYQFLSANGLATFDTYEAETAADAIIWNGFARKSADIHEFCHSLSFDPF